MSLPGTEGALLLLALALYLFDAAQLLASDEWLIEQHRGGRWHARFGLQGWPIAHKEPWLPSPLAPWRPVLRLHWRFEVGPEEVAAPSAPPMLALPGPALRAVTGLLLALVFLALPVALLAYPLLALKIGVALAIYASCLFQALLLWREHARLGLSRGECAKLAVECIVCPPFALNLVRKLGLRQSARVASDQALQMLAPDEREAARQGMLLRLREQIDFEPEGTARMAQLQATAARLEQEHA